MSTEENKALIRRVFEEAINQGNTELVDILFSPDFIDHSTSGQVPGPQGVKAYFAEVRTGFPYLRVRIDDIVAEGDRVVVRTTWQGTQRGVYEGHAPSGRRVTRTMIQIFRVADGKIGQEWNQGRALLQ